MGRRGHVRSPSCSAAAGEKVSRNSFKSASKLAGADGASGGSPGGGTGSLGGAGWANSSAGSLGAGVSSGGGVAISRAGRLGNGGRPGTARRPEASMKLTMRPPSPPLPLSNRDTKSRSVRSSPPSGMRPKKTREPGATAKTTACSAASGGLQIGARGASLTRPRVMNQSWFDTNTPAPILDLLSRALRLVRDDLRDRLQHGEMGGALRHVLEIAHRRLAGAQGGRSRGLARGVGGPHHEEVRGALAPRGEFEEGQPPRVLLGAQAVTARGERHVDPPSQRAMRPVAGDDSNPA